MTADTLSLPIERVAFRALPPAEWAELVRESHHEHYNGMGEMYGGVVTVEDKVRQIRRWGEGIFAWTARDGGRLVALLTGDLDDGRLTVYDFYIRRAYQRRGLGRALLRAALAEPGLREAGAEINLDNLASRALFESEGFRLARAVGWFVRP